MKEESRHKTFVGTFNQREQGRDLMRMIYRKVTYNDAARRVMYTDLRGKKKNISLYDVCSEVWDYQIQIKVKDIIEILKQLDGQHNK